MPILKKIGVYIWQQVCHRDLKLANTLLDGSPVPNLKICDFGFSKVQIWLQIYELTFTSKALTCLLYYIFAQSSMLHSTPKSIAGTLQYIAPEVLSGSEYNGKVKLKLCL